MNENPEHPTTEAITARARQIWEDEGQPEGKAEEHWLRAEAELRDGTNPPTLAQNLG